MSLCTDDETEKYVAVCLRIQSQLSTSWSISMYTEIANPSTGLNFSKLCDLCIKPARQKFGSSPPRSVTDTAAARDDLHSSASMLMATVYRQDGYSRIWFPSHAIMVWPEPIRTPPSPCDTSHLNVPVSPLVLAVTVAKIITYADCPKTVAHWRHRCSFRTAPLNWFGQQHFYHALFSPSFSSWHSFYCW